LDVSHRFSLVPLLILAGCGGAPQSKEAVGQAIVEHLGKRSDMMAASMKVDVVSVSFREKEADAIVSISPKEGGEGMQMSYKLALEGSKWVVKPSGSGGANPHQGMPAAPQGELPKGHPPIDSTGKPPAHP
jgi:hypothetical protein